MPGKSKGNSPRCSIPIIEKSWRVKTILSNELVASFPGIRLRRDNWVSVRYAEELNSGKSSVTPQRTDRHGILGEKLTDFHVSL